MNLKTFLEMMIVEEEAAKQKYELIAAQTEDGAGRDMLLKLAYEEDTHADLLRQYLDKL
ncbi:MAG: hypothetical protein JXA37_01105 [Chloroflexia bacterium]|nr:hypothetical protein [Chloroflexia bacterium]